MARIKKSYLKVLVDNNVPTIVCTQYEDRFAGYNVIPKDVFMAFPREYTSLIEDPLKVRDPENRDIITLPCNDADKVFFSDNYNKFKKAYEAKGEKVFETVYGSLKELRKNHTRKVRKKA